MKTKKILIAVIVVIFSMIFVSCSGPSKTSGTEKATVEQANNALADGDAITARNAYAEVLQDEPNNVEANAGYAISESVEQLDEIAAIMEQLNGIESSSVIARGYTDFWNDINFDEIQTKLTTEIIPALEDAKSKLEYVLANIDRLGNHTLKFYPNDHDWNNDRLKSKTTPLNFGFEPFENNSETRVWWVLFDTPEGAVIDDEVFYELLLDQMFDSSKRGDAWFDKETFEQIAATGSLPEGYSPTFDNQDYIEVNENEIKIMLAMINAQLMMLEPLVIYDMSPDQSLQTNLDAIFSGSLAEVVQTCRDIDRDDNGIISNEEFQALMGDSFLEFLENNEGGLDAIEDWEDAILDFVTLVSELVGEGGYNFESKQLIIDVLTQLEAYVTDTSEKIELPNIIDDDDGVEYLIIASYFENPENFENLKNFLPSLDYPEISLNPADWNFVIIFADATFGGLIEGFTDTYTINFQDFLDIE